MSVAVGDADGLPTRGIAVMSPTAQRVACSKPCAVPVIKLDVP